MALRILIVEDDKHIRRILETLLTRDPVIATRRPEVIVAEDGKLGLEALAQGRFDLVVSDLLMPRMDGFQFCRELRKHPNGQDVPLVVTSAIYKDPQTIARLQSEVGAEFFAKPFQIRELMAMMRRLLVESAEPARAAAPKPVQPAARSSSGSIADCAPPRLLLELAEKRATGTLTLVRGQVRKEISLLHGTPVAVTSNLRTETLGHFLVARGLIDVEQHRQALERAQQGSERLGHVLLELGWLDEKELMKQLGAQMRAKLTNVLRWREGTFEFTPGEPPSDRLQTPVEAPRAIFVGLQRTARVDEIAQDLQRVSGRIGLTLRAERYREPFSRVFGAGGLARLSRRPLLDELLAGTDPAATMVQLDALLVCGMAEIEPADAAASSERAASGDRLRAADPSLAAPAQTRNLYDELFGEEDSEVRPQPGAPEAGNDDDDPSGVMQLPVGPAAAQAAADVVEVAQVHPEAAPDPEVEALRKEVLAVFLALHGKDFYQVLGAPRDAPPEEIAAAYAAVGRRFRLERFSGVDLGRDYARLEEIHQILRQAFETLSSPSEREKYDRSIEDRAAPSHAALDADLFAQEAAELIARGELEAARAKLTEAVAVAPDQADYHAQLGWAVFLAESAGEAGSSVAIERAAGRARIHLERAFAIDPESLDGHDFAGRIAALAGDDARALGHLERVLDADPSRADALAALEGAHARSGDWKRLERQYRKLIHRLGDRHDPERALRLWWRLAELYRTRLGDRESARVAYEIAAGLAPEDPRPREALARLHAEDPASWRAAAQALRESFRLAPEEPRHGRALFQLHHQSGRWDAALAAAQALSVREVDEPAAADFLRRFRPRFLARAQARLGPKELAALRHPEEDALLTELFAHLFGAHAPSLSLDEVGVKETDQIEFDMLPEPFRKVASYLAVELGVEVPRVFRRADFGAEAHVAATSPRALLAGPQALAASDRLALGFRLGRALSYLKPGRVLTGALPSHQLKVHLLAAVTLAQPGLQVDDAGGQIAAERGQLARIPELARALQPIVQRLLASPQATLNLSRHVRGLARTADRIGLALTGDVEGAVRIAAESGVPGAAAELLDFALSPEYLEAREALGLSVAV